MKVPPKAVFALPSKLQRTRVANGRALFLTSENVDERSDSSRRFREVFRQICAETCAGDPSEAQAQLARRASALAVWCESAEAKMAKGEPIDIGAFTTAANSLRRLLADLGLGRKARDITPTLDQYLRTRRRADEAAA